MVHLGELSIEFENIIALKLFLISMVQASKLILGRKI